MGSLGAQGAGGGWLPDPFIWEGKSGRIALFSIYFRILVELLVNTNFYCGRAGRMSSNFLIFEY
jgi:hypothetical protein